MWNVLADNRYIKISCSECGHDLADIDTKYKRNITCIICERCSNKNNPFTWIEKPIIKNPKHDAIVYFNKY